MKPRAPGPAPKRLLIVDDHAGVREVFIFQMNDEGFMIGEAADGQEALALISRAKPDLILLDMLMPKLDGLGVLKELQARGLGTIPVIAMTGLDEVFPKETVLAFTNVVAYLTKPFSYDGLADHIRAFIEKGVRPAPQSR